jgi:S-adenosylmethionine decarboxylase
MVNQIHILINAGVTVITEQWHNFGQGYTGVIILAKSHISIYTWPEDGFAVIDICMYGDNVYFDKTVKHIETFFKTKIPNVITINRGIPIHNPLEDMKHLLKI